MRIKLFLPQDTTACALGADHVAEAIEQEAIKKGINIDLVRNGSRGMFWLEPLLEVEVDDQRIVFGPLQVSDVADVLTAITDTKQHALCLGALKNLPYFNQQQRVTFGRAGVADPLSLSAYRQQHGFIGLENALRMTPQEVVDEIKNSGLRGRGGAAFPAGIKWQTVLSAKASQKYIVCNADEGDSGTFADRLLMEADPFQLIEGMTIAGLAVEATRGYIYLRSEYPKAYQQLTRAISIAEQEGYLGANILGSNKQFTLEVRLGAGAYICGEETSLLESLEGKRGLVRFKPPLPAVEGLFGKPTAVNNVLTLAAVSSILADGADQYQQYGLDRSRGTMPFQLAGNIKYGGVVEIPFGATLRQIINNFGGGTFSGRPIRAIQVGGPLGAYLPEEQWDTPLDYEAFSAINAMLGHGGIVVFDDTVDMAEQARFAMEFCVEESCGKCTPCRIGSVRGVEVIDKIRKGDQTQDNLILLHDLCDTMEQGSLCAMGGLTPTPVKSVLNHFPEDMGVSTTANAEA
jgi:formate dehydrogenase iron-sulfur subunit